MPSAAYLAALDAEELRRDPASLDSLVILVREGEYALARELTRIRELQIGAQAITAWLVAHRRDGGMFAAPDDDDPRLEALIAEAVSERDAGSTSPAWRAARGAVEAVARRLVDRTPGAASADTAAT